MPGVNRASFLFGTTTAAAFLPRRAGAQALTTLRLGTSSGDDVTPIIYGQKSGIFAKYGLDIQVNRMTGAAAAGLVGGSFDLGKAVITTLLEAHENELPLSVVAAASVLNPKATYVAFLLRKDSPIRTGKDFNDQFVGVGTLTDVGQVAMLKWVDEHGGDAKSIKFVEVPTTAGPAAVDQGRLAASESTYPVIAAALETGRLRIAPILDVLESGCVITAWATTKEFSTKHPDAIRAFARAWRESATYTNVHHGETVEMMSEFTGISAALIAKMPRATAGTTLAPAQIQPVIEAAVKYGTLKRAFPAAELIDPNATVRSTSA